MGTAQAGHRTGHEAMGAEAKSEQQLGITRMQKQSLRNTVCYSPLQLRQKRRAAKQEKLQLDGVKTACSHI